MNFRGAFCTWEQCQVCASHQKIHSALHTKYWKVILEKFLQEGLMCVCVCEYECECYFFKELSQLLSPGVPRAHGLLRSHHSAHTPALTVLCWAVHLPRLLRVRRQHLDIADNKQTDRQTRSVWESPESHLRHCAQSFYFLKKGHRKFFRYSGLTANPNNFNIFLCLCTNLCSY